MAHELSDWHGGPTSGLFAVSNSWLQGRDARSEDVDRALDELQGLLDRDPLAPSERQHVQDLKARLELGKPWPI